MFEAQTGARLSTVGVRRDKRETLARAASCCGATKKARPFGWAWLLYPGVALARDWVFELCGLSAFRTKCRDIRWCRASHNLGAGWKSELSKLGGGMNKEERPRFLYHLQSLHTLIKLTKSSENR